MARSLTRCEDWPRDAVGVRRPEGDPRPRTPKRSAAPVASLPRSAMPLLGPQTSAEWGRSPQPSEGQQCLQLWIQGWLRLLGLALGEQIIEEPGEPDQPPAPALLTEPDQQAIAAGGELKATGGVGVSGGHAGRSAGRHLQAGRGQGPATNPRCAASCGTTVSQPRAWLRSLTPPRTMKWPAQRFIGYETAAGNQQRKAANTPRQDSTGL